MQVENVNRVCAQLLQARVEVLLEPIWLVHTGFVRVDLCGERESAISPLRITCPCLLLATDIHARCVDFIVALTLEVVEMLCELIEVRYACSSSIIGTFQKC